MLLTCPFMSMEHVCPLRNLGRRIELQAPVVVHRQHQPIGISKRRKPINVVDFSFIVSSYVSDLPNVTKSNTLYYGTSTSTASKKSLRARVLIVTLGKSETYKETIKEKSQHEYEYSYGIHVLYSSVLYSSFTSIRYRTSGIPYSYEYEYQSRTSTPLYWNIFFVTVVSA